MGPELILGLGIASTLATAAGTFAQYQGQQKQAKAAEEAARFNRDVSEQNAVASQQQAAADAAIQRDKARRFSGTQTAAAAKSGASLDDTFNDVSFDSAVQLELDALNTEYKGNVAANRFRNQGALAYAEGMNQASAAKGAGIGTLIGGFAKTADRGFDLLKLRMG